MEQSIGAQPLFLVSGGARGITAHCVIFLARRNRCRFILLGRTPVEEPVPDWAGAGADPRQIKQRIADELRAGDEQPTPAAIQRRFDAITARREIAATLQALAAAGSVAEYVRADITDGPSLIAALTPVLQRCGSVTGIIHGAGSLADKRIEHKQAADFEAVYGPKVYGLQNLLACVPPAGLRYVVLFSSAAGFYGNPGQSDYAIANEVLNKAAYQLKRENPGCAVIAINWGPWDGGMVTPALRRLFAERKIDVIPPDAGAQIFLDQLAAGPHAAVQVIAGAPMVQVPVPLERMPRTVRIRRHLSLAANPFLRDHTIGGHAVLPVTCAVAWLADSCEQCCPGYRTFRTDDFQVLKGIVFDETLASCYTLELAELDRSEERGEIRFQALVSSTTGTGAPRYHYRVLLTLRREIPEAPIDPACDLHDDASGGQSPYRDGTLFHGRSFQGVERILNISLERLTLRCMLPPVSLVTQGQFATRTVNPFLADVGLQGLLIWARRIHNAASLPLSTTRAEQYRSLQFDQVFYVSLKMRSSDDNHLSADITMHDEHGRMYLRFFDARVAISRQLDRLFRPPVELAPTG